MLISVLLIFAISFSDILITPKAQTTYISLTIQNSQPTPSPFQQLVNISVNEIEQTLFNQIEQNPLDVLFYEPGVGNLYAWIENFTSRYILVWVKLPYGISASSSVTVYMYITSQNQYPYTGINPVLWAEMNGYKPNSNGLFSDDPNYGQYDNGQHVFNYYWNFAGTTAPSGINVYINDGNVTFDNGVNIKGGTSTIGGENGIATSISFSPPVVVDYIGTQSTSPPGDSWGWNMVGFSNYLSSSDCFPARYGTYTLIDFEGSHSYESGYPKSTQGGTDTAGNIPLPSSSSYVFPFGVWTQEYLPNAYYTFYNYGEYSTGNITGASNTASLP